ncbi:hypothetical protein TrLO_g13136 [Triparma laevis f. longispina]|uniref:Uncharacterized protein n=1 Tax=Triparma laevis f. longispina TaxID=1714387 RepID=A0A9W7F8J9_9STRA|nr:hypothetical protein TrLO_g13136 [Triparma laevis f. longispina]
MQIRSLLLLLLLTPVTLSFTPTPTFLPPRTSNTSLNLDTNYIIGGAVGLLGLGAGIGIVAFTEKQGDRTIERGGLSDSTVNNLSGMFMEDVEVSSVNDVGGLVERLEEALKEAGGEVEDLDEEEIRKKQEELDDGW